MRLIKESSNKLVISLPVGPKKVAEPMMILLGRVPRLASAVEGFAKEVITGPSPKDKEI